MNRVLPSTMPDISVEMDALIETLHRTGQRLEELTGGQVDAVTDHDGRTFLLRHAQGQLRQNEASKQAAILNALPAHIAMLDPSGVIVSVNDTWRQFVDTGVVQGPGYPVGVNYLAICAGAWSGDAGAHAVAEGIREVLGGGLKTFSIEYPCHSETERRWLLLTVTPLADDRANGAVIMHTNITAQQLAKEELRASRARFTEMLDNVELVAVMLDRDACITYCNDCLLRLTGWLSDEVIGCNWFDRFVPAEVGDMKPMFAALLANLPEAWHVENDLLTRSGERRLIRWSNTVLRSGAGLIIGTASIGEDITDRRAAEIVVSQRADQLERFHRLSVGRELQMIDLKKQINAMAAEAGRAPAYDLTFLEGILPGPGGDHAPAP